MDEEVKYEMRIPQGVSVQILANVMEKFSLEVKQSDDGPFLYGEKDNLEDARDYIVKALNERIKDLEGVE
ncbi:MAG: hypothetical protein ACLQG5_03085 [Methanobacterium sp.]|jgi:hypothetical protein